MSFVCSVLYLCAQKWLEPNIWCLILFLWSVQFTTDWRKSIVTNRNTLHVLPPQSLFYPLSLGWGSLWHLVTCHEMMKIRCIWRHFWPRKGRLTRHLLSLPMDFFPDPCLMRDLQSLSPLFVCLPYLLHLSVLVYQLSPFSKYGIRWIPSISPHRARSFPMAHGITN